MGLFLSRTGKSTARLERCLARKPDVNKANEMGVTALMFACAAWSVPFVKRLLEEKANLNQEDNNGFRAMNLVDDLMETVQAAAEQEREECRRRRIAMEVTGTLLPDSPTWTNLNPSRSCRSCTKFASCWNRLAVSRTKL